MLQLIICSLFLILTCVSGQLGVSGVYDVSFGQLDWCYGVGSCFENSSFGQLSYKYIPDATITYYLNLHVKYQGGATIWSTQNLPLFAVDSDVGEDDDFSERSESVFFNLLELGVSEGISVGSLDYNLDIRPTMMTTAQSSSVVPSIPAVVMPLIQKIVDPPAEHSVNTTIVGTSSGPGAPVDVRFDATGAAPVKVNKDRKMNPVQEGDEKCLPGAFARSLDWLNRKFKLKCFPDSAQKIYEDLIKKEKEKAATPGKTHNQRWIELKSEYAKEKSKQQIITKMWYDNKFKFFKSKEVTQETFPDICFTCWLEREFPTEDVEVAYVYQDKAGNWNGHMVTLVNLIKKGNKYWVRYRDDEDQGDDENSKKNGDKAVKGPLEIKKKDDGWWRFGNEKWFVYFAISESFKPLPGKTEPCVCGDPHFKTWVGESYDFHGVCDLVLLRNPAFENGLGMDIHIRTEKTRLWSYVSAAAIRIGHDTLEVIGGKTKRSQYWINGIEGKDEHPNNMTTSMTLSGYPVSFEQESSKSYTYVIDLGTEDEKITIKTWNGYVRVGIHGGRSETFGGSMGLIGLFPTGEKVARDNETVVNDINAFGLEWQVLGSEPMLFHNIDGPQYPQKCQIPSSEVMRRRLSASTITVEEAQEVCSNVNEADRDLCAFDVMATNSKDLAGAY